MADNILAYVICLMLGIMAAFLINGFIAVILIAYLVSGSLWLIGKVVCKLQSYMYNNFGVFGSSHWS